MSVLNCKQLKGSKTKKMLPKDENFQI